MGSYQNTPNLKIKKWHIGVIALASLSFTQPEPKEKRTSEIKLPKESEKALKVRNLELAKKGIDLNKRHLEVKKLFLKHCAKMCLDNRCDPEDVLQEVYKGILIRNNGKCPFDEAKAAFSTYIVMVSRCVTINYINKIKKKTEGEVYGNETTIEQEDYMIGGSENSSVEDELYFSELRALLKEELTPIYDDLLAGFKVSHISRRRSLDTRKVNKYIEDIRKTLEPYVRESAPC
jgi:hypothetical protein